MIPTISVGLPTQRSNDNYSGNYFFQPIPVDERGMLVFSNKRTSKKHINNEPDEEKINGAIYGRP